MSKQPTVLQMDIVSLWAQGKTRQEIADELKCAKSQVDKCKNDPDLKRLYWERQRAQIEELVPAAVKRLQKLIHDDNQQGTVHIAAIREILDRSHLKELMETVGAEVNITITYE